MTTDAAIESRIRAAYEEILSTRTQSSLGWVDLTEIRQRLGTEFRRDAVDRVLDAMIESPDVYLMAELHRGTLTPEREAAAVMIGGEQRHYLNIGHF